MKTPLALAAILAPLAGAFAAATHHPADEDAATRTWIALARQAARPDADLPPSLPAAPAQTGRDEPPASALLDPFRLGGTADTLLDPEQGELRLPARKEHPAASASPSPAPPIRLLGTLLQDGAACAIVQVAGVSYRLRPGDALPGGMGHVLKITADAIEITGMGTVRLPGSGA